MYVYYALIQAHINACKMENARNLKQTNDVDNDVISSIVSVFGFFFLCAWKKFHAVFIAHGKVSKLLTADKQHFR